MQNYIAITIFQPLGITFLIAFFNLNVIAFDTFPDSSVVLKHKVYLDDEPANNDVADSVTVKVVEINSRKKDEYFEESGMFDLKLDLGKHFLIYVSKGGYETHFFEFSTVGVKPGMNLVFYLDITLGQQVGLGRRLTGGPSNKLKYNCVEKDKYINISPGTSITLDTKGTN